jgi:hypothetical protein
LAADTLQAIELDLAADAPQGCPPWIGGLLGFNLGCGDP